MSDEKKDQGPNWEAAIAQVDGMSALCPDGRDQVKELLRTLAGVEETLAMLGLWAPAQGERYWAVRSDGRVENYDRATEWDERCIGYSNIFPSQELAEKEARYLKTFNKMRRCREAIGYDADPSKMRFAVAYARSQRRLEIVELRNSSDAIYASTKEGAERLRDALTLDEWKTIFEVSE